MSKAWEIQMQANIRELIDIERERQRRIWGKQDHSDFKWVTILIEEVGEASQAFLKSDHLLGIAEVVEAAAVCEAWLENWETCAPSMIEKAKEYLQLRLAGYPLKDDVGVGDEADLSAQADNSY